jgi:hypothetical protein
MDYIISNDSITLNYNPEKLTCKIDSGKNAWEWCRKPSVVLHDESELFFYDAECSSEYCKTGVAEGVRATYSGFGNTDIAIHTFVWLNPSTGEINFEVRSDKDKHLEIKRLQFPAPFALGSDKGYTVLPRMQGTLVPAGTTISIADGRIQERDGYMSFFGQVREDAGYIAIYTTPYDAHYRLPGSDTVMPYFIESMGSMRYKRSMSYRFFDSGCDYVTIAKAYREYMKETGQFVSLAEKIQRNPNIAKLIGSPVIHTGIAVHISPESNYYNPDEPDKNDFYTSFDECAEKLRKLKNNGLETAYVHLDGWGNHGYDNLHPDPFPPHEAAGGTEGMKRLSETCRELGYEFGIHDQYRDYYYDAPSFSPDNAVLNPDGTRPYCSIWYGGPHSWLCASLAPEYVRRNYDEFERLGIKIEGAYLDVFSVVGLDECVSDDHPMTREECVSYRRRCFDILTYRGIIPSSEETIDSIVPAIALCHHAPYFTKNLGNSNSDPAGIHVPLFNLVYHDAMVIPWYGIPGERGGWGIPRDDSGFLHALLNGGTVYCPENADAETIRSLEIALDLHRQVALQEMVGHSLVDGNHRRQKSVFADGTCVEVDFDDGTYRISIPGQHVISGNA